jgi:hypothetical protein
VLIRLLVLVLSVAPAACAGDRENPDEVEKAMLRAGILGQPPVEVERRLRALRFEEGRRLELDSFNSRMSELGGALRDSLREPRIDWNAHVRVTFDSAGRLLRSRHTTQQLIRRELRDRDVTFASPPPASVALQLTAPREHHGYSGAAAALGSAICARVWNPERLS